MPRAIWKGAISFGLVHVPVALYPAAQEAGIDFDWLDKRSMDPVGYKRINKRTGKDIQSADIVKGIKQDAGDYVILSDEQIKNAYPKSTQAIEIEAFVKAAEISFTLLDQPYYLEPVGKGEKVYALLRDAMYAAGVIGIARVVLHTKEHLAALIPNGDALMLNTLRWATELRPSDDFKFTSSGKAAIPLKKTELEMAGQLIEDMTKTWAPESYTDHFAEAVRALVNDKVAAGQTHTVLAIEDKSGAADTSNIVDLTQLLANSLLKRKPADATLQPGGAVKTAKATVAKKIAKK